MFSENNVLFNLIHLFSGTYYYYYLLNNNCKECVFRKTNCIIIYVFSGKLLFTYFLYMKWYIFYYVNSTFLRKELKSKSKNTFNLSTLIPYCKDDILHKHFQFSQPVDSLLEHDALQSRMLQLQVLALVLKCRRLLN